MAPPEEDEEVDFEQRMHDLHTELADLNTEAIAVGETIQQNLVELGA